MELLLVALGAFALTEFFKYVLPWPVKSWVKLTVAYAFAMAIAVSLAWGGPTEIGLALAFAGTGSAMLLHKAHRLLSAAGDEKQAAIMLAAASRQRR